MLRHNILEILLKLPLNTNQSILKCSIYQTTETILSQINVNHLDTIFNIKRDGRGRDRMVVGLTTTYAISAYHN